MIPLTGHVSIDTAYEVQDYPYSFKLRCKIRYWIERDPKKGFRFCSQTTDPRKGNVTWNAPKKSTYSLIAGAMFLDEKEHVQWTGLSGYSGADECKQFIELYPGACSDQLERWCGMKARYCLVRAESNTLTIFEKEEAASEAVVWQELMAILNSRKF